MKTLTDPRMKTGVRATIWNETYMKTTPGIVCSDVSYAYLESELPVFN
jgi:hypothetical protein